MSKQYKIDLYLDWFNNFLTIASFAAWHGLTIEQAERVIIEGRAEHEARLFADI